MRVAVTVTIPFELVFDALMERGRSGFREIAGAPSAATLELLELLGH